MYKNISKKLLVLVLSVAFVLGFSIQVLATYDYRMKNVSYDKVVELSGHEIELEFDENGIPKTTTGVIPYALGVVCVWNLQKRSGYDNM